jgi:hypothetical protein
VAQVLEHGHQAQHDRDAASANVGLVMRDQDRKVHVNLIFRQRQHEILRRRVVQNGDILGYRGDEKSDP